MIRKLCLIAGLALIQGCAGNVRSTPDPVAAEPRTQEAAQLRAVHTDLIEEMIRQENYHAALAHIEELQRGDVKDNKLLLMHARVMFKLGHINEAHNEYLQLMNTDYEPEALHGIGLIHAINNPNLSLEYMARASEGRPTQASIRNDYGYALLRKGQYSKASLHLSTAHELAPSDAKYRNNAVLALLILNDAKGAERLVEKTAMPKELVNRIRDEARKWQLQGQEALPATAAAATKAETKPEAEPNVEQDKATPAQSGDEQVEPAATVAQAS